MNNMTNVIRPNEARVNVTWQGENGDLPDPVSYDATDGDVKQFVTEAVRTGGIPGIRADMNADFTNFIVERFPATEEVPFNRLVTRPKTPFGRAAA